VEGFFQFQQKGANHHYCLDFFNHSGAANDLDQRLMGEISAREHGAKIPAEKGVGGFSGFGDGSEANVCL
jgi:hypothetical protein